MGTTRHIESRKMVLREGYTADRVFVVCSGRIKITASSAEGRLLLLRIAGPGDVLGLASILIGKHYRVSAESIEPCELKSVPRGDFLTLMDDFPEFSRSTALAVSREYDAALFSARRLALSTSAAGKLASALLDWARMNHTHDVTTLAFSMPLTHEELGCMAGLSRETVTRLLSRFRSEGLLEQHGETMLLQQPEKLQALYC
jgi:CRP/FNR family transcriptional regulator